MTKLWHLSTRERAAATAAEIEAAIGKRFGQRTVLRRVQSRAYDNGRTLYYKPCVLMRCDCGKEHEVVWAAVKAGKAQRCVACGLLARWGSLNAKGSPAGLPFSTIAASRWDAVCRPKSG